MQSYKKKEEVMDKAGKYWGSTRRVFFQNNVEIHYLEILPGGYCSEHLHKMKYNRFVILSGTLQVKTWKSGEDRSPDIVNLEKFDEYTIKPNIFHKFENTSSHNCEAVEIYWTELNPDDIERRTIGGVL